MTHEHRPTPGGASPTQLAELCSLDPVALDERWAMIRREIQPHAIAARTLDNSVAWDFDATLEMRAKLENLARLERDCCDGLDFDVWENSVGTRLRFEITGADPGTGFFDGLSLAEPSGPASSGIRWKRVARRSGLAIVASLFFCCVLPVAMVSIAGAAVAAPLMKLDNPASIAGGAVVIGTLVWLYEKRHARAAGARSGSSASADAGCDC